MIDPASATSVTGFNRATNSSTTANESEEVWVTLEQLSGPMYLNSMEHAAITIKSLPSQPHDDDNLAAAGVLQYRYSSSKNKSKKQ